MQSHLLGTEHWLAVLRIGIGLWWLESWRHKDKRAWLERGAGIDWAASVAEKHPWALVRSAFSRLVLPRRRAASYLVVFGELAIGLGLTLGFLTPVAAGAGLILNVAYFILMIKDWAEQGQNSMMALIEVVVLGTAAWQAWSLDAALGLF
ncbi:MAG: DoxX family protein [Actinomycetota bacterium]|nr:DoxX family protein [Actinomycetota bacterium]PLS76210.1 MAG: DoxX family protein [Actinomycetota bacterium]